MNASAPKVRGRERTLVLPSQAWQLPTRPRTGDHVPGRVLFILYILPCISSSQYYFIVGVGSNLPFSGFMFPCGRISIRVKLLVSCSLLQFPWRESFTSLVGWEEELDMSGSATFRTTLVSPCLKKGRILFCCRVSWWAEWSRSAPGDGPVFPFLPVPNDVFSVVVSD